MAEQSKAFISIEDVPEGYAVVTRGKDEDLLPMLVFLVLSICRDRNITVKHMSETFVDIEPFYDALHGEMIMHRSEKEE